METLDWGRAPAGATRSRSMLYRRRWALLSPVGRIAALQGLKFSWVFAPGTARVGPRL
jgi:hypothetical protein